MPQHTGKPRCPCCGLFAMTDSEECVLAALSTAPDCGVTMREIAERIGKKSVPNILRILRSLAAAGIAESAGKRNQFKGGPESLYRATEAGRRACAMLAGRISEAAE
jgi:DNA-binding PadR family transcriptional regulator